MDPVLAGLDEVTRSVAGTQPGGGTRPVLCGTIPFDPDEPADLFLAERPVWAPAPRPRPRCPWRGSSCPPPRPESTAR